MEGTAGQLSNQLFPMTVAMGLLVSPEGLTILGNAAGRAGHGLFYVLMGAGLLHVTTAMAYQRIYAQYPGPFGEMGLIGKALSPVAALWVSAFARLIVAVCASTALLATAGYIFNEVFLYWFPNLGFSFCLLGLLFILNLSDMRVAATGQVLFVGLAVGGLLFLFVAGFLEWGNLPPPMPDGPTAMADFPRTALACLLLFVGFDLAAYAGVGERNPAKAMMAAIILAGLVLSMWGWVSAAYVPAERLADTSIPHVRTARAVLGETGRIWMGMIALAGASAAVNALLMAIGRMMGIMAAGGLLPPFLAMGKHQATVGMSVLVAAVAAMLGSGMAGEPILEVYIKAGLCFWLLHYIVILAAVLKMTVEALPGSPVQSAMSYRVLLLAGVAAMALAFTGMFVLNPEWKLLLRTVAILLAIGLILVPFWVSFSRKKGWLKTL